jgi:hypothetical protein
MYKIGAAGHPCLAERDIAKNFDMKPTKLFIRIKKDSLQGEI